MTAIMFAGSSVTTMNDFGTLLHWLLQPPGDVIYLPRYLLIYYLCYTRDVGNDSSLLLSSSRLPCIVVSAKGTSLDRVIGAAFQ